MAFIMNKALSVTIKDCTIQTFRAGGKGGQNQNKRDSGVRLIHEPSGAVGESREHRTQLENKKAAFVKLAKNPKFIIWVNRVLYGYDRAEKEVAEMMQRQQDIRVEYKHDNKWVIDHGSENEK